MPEPKPQEEVTLLISGNPVDGFNYEIFDDFDEALRWAETAYGYDYWVKVLTRSTYDIGWSIP